MPTEEWRKEVGLPVRPFLYTIEQIAGLLSCSVDLLHRTIAYYEGRSVHRRRPMELHFVNIAKPEDKPLWRCSEQELVRWMRFKQIKVYDSSWSRR